MLNAQTEGFLPMCLDRLDSFTDTFPRKITTQDERELLVLTRKGEESYFYFDENKQFVEYDGEIIIKPETGGKGVL